MHTAPPPKPAGASTPCKKHLLKRDIMHELHSFPWASLPSGSEELKLITSPNLCFKELKGFETVKPKDAFQHHISLPCDSLSLPLESSTCSLVHCFPKQYNWHSRIYVLTVTDFREKDINPLQNKDGAALALSNSYIQYQPASISLVKTY